MPQIQSMKMSAQSRNLGTGMTLVNPSRQPNKSVLFSTNKMKDSLCTNKVKDRATTTNNMNLSKNTSQAQAIDRRGCVIKSEIDKKTDDKENCEKLVADCAPLLRLPSNATKISTSNNTQKNKPIARVTCVTESKIDGKQQIQQSEQAEKVSNASQGSPDKHGAGDTPSGGTHAPGSAIVAGQMFKTKFCIDHHTRGCTRGENCPYAHTLDELRHLPDLSKTKMCTALLSGTGCTNSKCNYAHSEEELRYTCHFTEFKTRLCRFAHRHGGRGCLYGSKCPYAHSMEELVTAHKNQPKVVEVDSTLRSDIEENLLPGQGIACEYNEGRRMTQNRVKEVGGGSPERKRDIYQLGTRNGGVETTETMSNKGDKLSIKTLLAAGIGMKVVRNSGGPSRETPFKTILQTRDMKHNGGQSGSKLGVHSSTNNKSICNTPATLPSFPILAPCTREVSQASSASQNLLSQCTRMDANNRNGGTSLIEPPMSDVAQHSYLLGGGGNKDPSNSLAAPTGGGKDARVPSEALVNGNYSKAGLKAPETQISDPSFLREVISKDEQNMRNDKTAADEKPGGPRLADAEQRQCTDMYKVIGEATSTPRTGKECFVFSSCFLPNASTEKGFGTESKDSGETRKPKASVGVDPRSVSAKEKEQSKARNSSYLGGLSGKIESSFDTLQIQPEKVGLDATESREIDRIAEPMVCGPKHMKFPTLCRVRRVTTTCFVDPLELKKGSPDLKGPPVNPCFAGQAADCDGAKTHLELTETRNGTSEVKIAVERKQNTKLGDAYLNHTDGSCCEVKKEPQEEVMPKKWLESCRSGEKGTEIGKMDEKELRVRSVEHRGLVGDEMVAAKEAQMADHKRDSEAGLINGNPISDLQERARDNNGDLGSSAVAIPSAVPNEACGTDSPSQAPLSRESDAFQLMARENSAQPKADDDALTPISLSLAQALCTSLASPAAKGQGSEDALQILLFKLISYILERPGGVEALDDAKHLTVEKSVGEIANDQNQQHGLPSVNSHGGGSLSCSRIQGNNESTMGWEAVSSNTALYNGSTLTANAPPFTPSHLKGKDRTHFGSTPLDVSQSKAFLESVSVGDSSLSSFSHQGSNLFKGEHTMEGWASSASALPLPMLSMDLPCVKSHVLPSSASTMTPSNCHDRLLGEYSGRSANSTCKSSKSTSHASVSAQNAENSLLQRNFGRDFQLQDGKPLLLPFQTLAPPGLDPKWAHERPGTGGPDFISNLNTFVVSSAAGEVEGMDQTRFSTLSIERSQTSNDIHSYHSARGSQPQKNDVSLRDKWSVVDNGGLFEKSSLPAGREIGEEGKEKSSWNSLTDCQDRDGLNTLDSNFSASSYHLSSVSEEQPTFRGLLPLPFKASTSHSYSQRQNSFPGNYLQNQTFFGGLLHEKEKRIPWCYQDAREGMSTSQAFNQVWVPEQGGGGASQARLFRLDQMNGKGWTKEGKETYTTHHGVGNSHPAGLNEKPGNQRITRKIDDSNARKGVVESAKGASVGVNTSVVASTVGGKAARKLADTALSSEVEVKKSIVEGKERDKVEGAKEAIVALETMNDHDKIETDGDIQSKGRQKLEEKNGKEVAEGKVAGGSRRAFGRSGKAAVSSLPNNINIGASKSRHYAMNATTKVTKRKTVDN